MNDVSPNDYFILCGLCCAAGMTAHMLFYRPTEVIPFPWRNLIRYAIGGLIMATGVLFYALLRPTVPALAVGYAAPLTLLSTGYGTFLGYLLTRDA